MVLINRHMISVYHIIHSISNLILVSCAEVRCNTDSFIFSPKQIIAVVCFGILHATRIHCWVPRLIRTCWRWFKDEAIRVLMLQCCFDDCLLPLIIPIFNVAKSSVVASNPRAKIAALNGFNTLRPRQNGHHVADAFLYTLYWMKMYEFWSRFH